MVEILLVDDDPGMIELITEELDKNFSGIKIVSTFSGYKAIKILQDKSDFELVISDYNMPDGTGSDVLNYLVQSRRPIFFILHTSDLNPILPNQLGDYFLGVVEKMNFEELSLILSKFFLQN